jgi:hypothetical protein
MGGQPGRVPEGPLKRLLKEKMTLHISDSLEVWLKVSYSRLMSDEKLEVRIPDGFLSPCPVTSEWLFVRYLATTFFLFAQYRKA